MFSAFSGRAPLRASPPASDKKQYVNLAACAPASQDSTSKLGPWIRLFHAPTLIAEQIGRSATTHTPFLDPIPEGRWAGLSWGDQGGENLPDCIRWIDGRNYFHLSSPRGGVARRKRPG